MAKIYDPEKVNASGPRSLYLSSQGDSDKAIVKCLEGQCHINAMPLSESVRWVLIQYYQSQGLLDAEEELTDRYPDFLEKASKSKAYHQAKLVAEFAAKESKRKANLLSEVF